MTKVTLRFAPYMRGEEQRCEIDARIVGELAIHRPAWISEAGELSIYRKSWTVSHIPSGDRVESAFPARFKDRGAIVATRDQLAQWADAWQAACPAFFDTVRDGSPEGGLPVELGRDALDKGRAL